MDQKETRKVFLESVEILQFVGLEFWLLCGTLLGAYRQQDFIPWDLDIDVGVWATKLEKCGEQIKARFLALGYESGIIYNKENNLPRAVKARRNGVKIDICGYYLAGNEAYCTSSNKDYSLVCSRYFLDSMDSISFQGIQVKIPTPTATYLLREYGPKWMIPDKSPQAGISKTRNYGYRASKSLAEQNMRSGWLQRNLTAIQANDSYHSGYYNYLDHPEFVAKCWLPVQEWLKGRVLDVGCGFGAVMCVLEKSFGYSYLGVDASSEVVKTATARWGGYPAFFQVARLEDFALDAEPQIYDTLIFGNILGLIKPQYLIRVLETYLCKFRPARIIFCDLQNHPTASLVESRHLLLHRHEAILDIADLEPVKCKRRVEVYAL